MPRTRVNKKADSIKANQVQGVEDMKKKVLNYCNEQVSNLIKEMEEVRDEALKEIGLEIYCVERSSVDAMKLTLGELKLQNSLHQSRMDKWKTMSCNKTRQRSLSCSSDGGYLTGENSQNSSKRTTRNSRVRKQGTAVKSTSKSRSLSRSKNTQGTNLLKTPMNQNNYNKTTFGTVTPKMKPNTPQVILRRPKQGEVAISLQGSPLMVSGVVTNETANVNIPLEDGAVLSIQPQRGLRFSQLPEIDENIGRQLKALRDNLDQVCSRLMK